MAERKALTMLRWSYHRPPRIEPVRITHPRIAGSLLQVGDPYPKPTHDTRRCASGPATYQASQPTTTQRGRGDGWQQREARTQAATHPPCQWHGRLRPYPLTTHPPFLPCGWPSTTQAGQYLPRGWLATHHLPATNPPRHLPGGG
jgi:hypothetical protein